MTAEPLTDNSPMPFGKYAGKPLRDVPASYLLWLADSMGKRDLHGPRHALRAYIDRNRKGLEQEVGEQGGHAHDLDD